MTEDEDLDDDDFFCTDPHIIELMVRYLEAMWPKLGLGTIPPGYQRPARDNVTITLPTALGSRFV